MTVVFRGEEFYNIIPMGLGVSLLLKVELARNVKKASTASMLLFSWGNSIFG